MCDTTHMLKQATVLDLVAMYSARRATRTQEVWHGMAWWQEVSLCCWFSVDAEEVGRRGAMG